MHVEFEILQGRANNTANTVLIGGAALKLAIERGVTGTGQTGVKPGTVQAKILDQKITGPSTPTRRPRLGIGPQPRLAASGLQVIGRGKNEIQSRGVLG